MPRNAFRAPPALAAPDSLPELALRLGGFTQTLAALDATGLSETLRGDGPFTLFAPTDVAWLRLEPGERARWLQPAQRTRLRSLLRHHLVAGRLQAQHFLGRHLLVPTLQGDALRLDGHHGLQADTARVLQSDLRARNGVLHAIDRLLLPERA